jgi:DNA repair exonuclease SbcCD ATPase subunit
MLHPLHALKSKNLMSVFNSEISSIALNDFILQLPDGVNQYYSTISDCYQNFYNSILLKSGKKLFLDKTPRYYLIIKELSLCFPKAKFIFLFRNPAAVLTSIIKTWAKHDFNALVEFKHDLLEALLLMLEASRNNNINSISCSYEELLTNPHSTIQELCKFLEIDFQSNIINYQSSITEKWRYGDKQVLYTKNEPDINHLNQWKRELQNKNIARLVYEYAILLGEDLFNKLGYSYNEIIDLCSHAVPEGKVEQEFLLTKILKDDYEIESCPQLYKELRTLKKKNLSLNNQIEENKTHGVRMESLIQQQKENIDQLNKQIHNYNENAKSQNIRIRDIETSLEQLKHAITEKELGLEKSKMQIENLTEIIKQKDFQIAGKEKLLKQFDDILITKEAEIKHFNDIQSAKEIEIKQLNDLLLARETETRKTVESKEKITKEKDELTKILMERSLDITDLNSKISALNNDLITYKNNILQKEMNIKSIEVLLTESQINTNKLKEKVREKESKIKELEDLLKRVEASYTFRIGKLFTSPYKALFKRNK